MISDERMFATAKRDFQTTKYYFPTKPHLASTVVGELSRLKTPGSILRGRSIKLARIGSVSKALRIIGHPAILD